MISLILLLVLVALVVGASGFLLRKSSASNFWLVVLGIIMLLPGVCGSFFLGVSFLDSGTSSEAQAYMTIFTSIAVPSIQLSCLLLWLMARNSDVVWFRKLTRYAGWFGAVAAGILLLNYSQMALNERGTFMDKAMIFGVGLLIAGVPFLIGGLQAIRVRPEAEAGS